MWAVSTAGGAHDEIDVTHSGLYPAFLMGLCIFRAETL